MRLHAVELVRVVMPLVRPFETSFGVQLSRNVALVHVLTDEAEGWGECTTGDSPAYSSEYSDGAVDIIRKYLIPPLFGQPLNPHSLDALWGQVKGHNMAKGAVEAAVLDAWLRAKDMSLAEYLGGVRPAVAAGVSIGIPSGIAELIDIVSQHLGEGYQRIKLKIKPGWDIAPLEAVRARFGEEMDLQVDANCAYRAGDIRHLTGLDRFQLTLLEQPFPGDDLESTARLRRSCATPICLDESIESVKDLFRAIRAEAVDIVNIKAGRVGGFLEARRIHDACRAAALPVWCGGMLETGVGRAGNIGLASLPGFTLPGDTSASDRYWKEDLTEPFKLVNGCLQVPDGPGFGVEVNQDSLTNLKATVETFRQ